MSYLGAAPSVGIYRSDYFSGDGSTSVFTLTYPTGNESSVIVSISGVIQASYTYSLYNGNIIFTGAPPAGANNIEVRYLGEKIFSTPPPVLSADTNGVVRINSNLITQNTVITTGFNASSAGPLTIANGIFVYVADGSVWHII